MLRTRAGIAFALAALFISVFSLCVAAEEPPRSDAVKIPTPLAPWVEWIRDRHPEWRCAHNAGHSICVWPGRMRLEFHPGGARFNLRAELLAEGLLALPSLPSLMPKNIRVVAKGGRELSPPLELKEGKLLVQLPRGEFEVSGDFTWDKMPPEFPVPAEYGVLEIDLDKSLDTLRPKRGEESLWLEQQGESSSVESLSISVMRRLLDGSPAHLLTLLRLRVSGASRSLNLGDVVPVGALPVSVARSSLPYQLSADGALALQLTPGEHEIRILSVLAQPFSEITLAPPSRPEWPREETWSARLDPAFRTVEFTDAQAVHADTTKLPQDWKDGPTFLIPSGGKLSLREVRRGEQAPALNELRLERELWIDLDGNGFTTQDSFSGAMHQGFRLNALPETKVGRVTVDGLPRIVTGSPADGRPGVELRESDLSMQAVSRIEDSWRISAIGWATAVNSLTTRLNLPPSWKLLFVGGAGTASGSWLDSWSLLDLFFAILITVAGRRLYGLRIAVVLGVLLLINHGEFLAPRMLLVHLMILTVWRGLVPEKGSVWYLMSRVLLLLTFVALVLEALTFSKLQVTQFLFPQLQSGTRYRTDLQELVLGIEASIFTWPMLLLVVGVGIAAVVSVMRAKSIWRAIVRIVLFGILAILLMSVAGGLFFASQMRSGAGSGDYSSYPSAPQKASRAFQEMQSEGDDVQQLAADAAPRLKQRALVSGPAIPTWRWRSHMVSVSGWVPADHKLSFYLLPPSVTRTLCGVRAALSLLFIYFLFHALGYSLRAVRFEGIGTVVALIVLAAWMLPSNAHAEFPPETLINELTEKLREAEVCTRDSCTTIQELSLEFGKNDFTATLVGVSDGVSVITLPGPLSILRVRSITSNGTEFSALRRVSGDYLQVQTATGKNVIVARGELPSDSAFALEFPQRPLHVQVRAESWYVEGLSPTGGVQSGLRLTARGAEQTKEQEITQTAASLATWAVVTRSIAIGDEITVQSTVRRIGDLSRPVYLRVPLLPGERVTSGAVNADGNELVVGFSVSEESITYSSVLPTTNELRLSAKAVSQVSESWRVSCDPSYSCTREGILPTASVVEGQHLYVWEPFPGEEALVRSKALSAITGDFVTVDSVLHQVQWGPTLLSGTVTATLRSTQQSSFSLKIPPGSTLQKVSLDGLVGTSSDGKDGTSVIISPGDHTIEAKYVKSWRPGFFEKAPELALSAKANNVTVRVAPSSERWLLYTGGLPWGPCVVFWAKLLFVGLLCVALAHLRLIPVSLSGAVFLGIGLTSVPTLLLGLPLVWLAALVLLPAFKRWVSRAPRIPRVSIFLLLTFLALVVFYQIVQTGLVLQPPMLVVGNGSSAASLNWFTDHAGNSLPQPWVISLPLWCWRVFSLIWSTWLVVALLPWLRLTIDRAKALIATES